MSSIYLGIDQSYSACAIVTYAPANDASSEHVYDFSPAKAGTGPQRLDYVNHILREHFMYLREQGTVGRVCFEGYSYGSKFRREEMGELGGILRLALVHNFSPHLMHCVAPSTVKKFATGSGRAEKDKMILAVFKRWHHEASTHDAADAYTLARIAAALDAPDPPEPAFQQAVLKTLRAPNAA